MSKETLNENLAESLDSTYFELDTDDSFNEDSFNLEARLLSSEHLSSSLPSLSFAAKATYSRDGNDLVLTLDGESVVVKNYFATPNPPTLTTMDGAVLTPQMVASFLQHGTEQDSQDFFASSFLNNLLGGNKSLDSSAIAVVENLEGSVLVIRNGKAIALQDGDQLFQGDEISTASDSSASMIFADGTQFKIGGEARISLDQFSYESSTSQGLQVLSILSGAFSYVSGLVAKDDPSNVQLRTPIGEIGIRGTKIVGEVDAENAAASITLIEGRVLYTTPQGEEHEIDQGFDTLNIKNGGDKVKETTISAERAARSYDVFENAGEVSEFMQQAPVTQQDQGAGASQDDASTDTPLPEISYSQAQVEQRAFIASDIANALEGRSISNEIVEQIVNIELQRAEFLQEVFGKDQTEDKSLIANNIVLGEKEPGVVAGGDDIYHIKLAERDGEVFLVQGGGGSAISDTLNFRFPEKYTIEFSFFKGAYDDGGGGTATPRTFNYFSENKNGDIVVKQFEFGVSDFVAGSDVEQSVDSPSGVLDDLRIQVTFNFDGDAPETFDLILTDYFPLSSNNVLPTYSISLNGGETKDLASYNEQIEGLLA